jgi:hypothetical protein
MKNRSLMLLAAASLAACGGSDTNQDGITSVTSSATRMLTIAAAGADSSVVTFPGIRSRYTIAASGSGFTVTDTELGGTPVTVSASQRLQFADTNIAFDTTGIAGQAYRLYRAAFNRTPDASGLGFWISVMDSGQTLASVSAGFVASTEFKDLVGANPTNRQLVTSLYTNVLGRTPDAGGLDFFTNVLDTKASDVAGVLAAMSESGENKTGTASLIATGIEYVSMTRVAANTVPGAPSIASISAGSGSATLTLTAPSSNGGSAITGYSAACSANGLSHNASSTTTTVNVLGLTNGTTYACTAKAVNALGSSAVSAATNVTPAAAPVVATVPSAPTIGAATAGNGSASIAFTAPSSNGGATITGFTATCTAGATSKTGTGSASPISVTGLTNGTAYSCSVTAANSVGNSAASSAVSVTPTSGSSGSSTITGSIFCSHSASLKNPTYTSLNSTVSISCSGTTRTLTGTGVPDHETGAFPNSGNPHSIKETSQRFTNTLNPAVTGSTTSVSHIIGYANNSVKFDPATAESYQNAGVWKIEALGQTYFAAGVDSSNAHVQPDGAYHYHGMPEKYMTKLGKGTAMTLVGFAVDGFPIYARYGYTSANDATSAIKVITSSYRMKTTPSSGRPSTSIAAMGTFTQDYEYVAGLGDLDECNGRTGVTPEFPNGIYHYFITDNYPYIQRCVKGTAASTGGGAK